MQQHPTEPLAVQCAIKVLRERAAGRSVDPDRLDWAIDLALLNRGRAVVPAHKAKEVSRDPT